MDVKSPISKQQLNQMSKLLQELKQSITKSRNLSYCGKYSESVASFQAVTETLTQFIPSLTDKTLITQWNRLLEQIQNQRDLAMGMSQVLLGNFDAQPPKRDRKIRGETSEREFKKEMTVDDFQDMKRNNHQPNFKKRVVHQDDQLYNRKQIERRQRDRAQKLDEEQRQKEFQDREEEIWPKKKPVLSKKNVQPKNSYGNPTPAHENKSGVGGAKGRQYSKPWLKGVKNPSMKVGDGEQKKTFLKSVYPDGQGPDANLIEMLEKEVVNTCPDITFDDIAELQKAKDVLQEAVLLPLMMPHLFKGIRRAWKGVLLFGPPGTGKTLLAKAIASGGKTTFFNVTASSVASKWKGDSEKLIRILFDMAKFYSPTTIFIDEIDSLASKRGEREDESSRKVKTELMARLDGVSSGGEDYKIVVIGASNCPWDIDDAIRRRLQKRIYIPLPNQLGRRQMLKINLKNQQMDSDVEIQELVKRTEGFSGSDIANFCREAAYMPMRKKLKKEGGIGKKLRNVEWMKNFQQEVTVPLSMDDFNQALKTSKPSVGKNELQKYQKWKDEFGEQGTNS